MGASSCKLTCSREGYDTFCEVGGSIQPLERGTLLSQEEKQFLQQQVSRLDEGRGSVR